ncbi:hypothetical protein E2562_025830 [Oryza meyeriana var. granulata]|uniref:Uncharacterized protein n=1 Tax=Oryza meyeriana var. granulata TaxID=110450 RepID=A0A6G1E2R4_9ORYZ|nr:hypothetical protein E2562_025830 [Oryza meyeriana var. granulata]
MICGSAKRVASSITRSSGCEASVGSGDAQIVHDKGGDDGFAAILMGDDVLSGISRCGMKGTHNIAEGALDAAQPARGSECWLGACA